MKVKKAIIPVAGKGTRFLPATKEVPKELLPIINIPMIYYVVKEAIDSGIETIIFVNSKGKESIEKFFERNLELEEFLIKNNKTELANDIKKIGSMVNFITVRQKEQLGLGHAVLMAKDLIDQGESFAVLLGDDIVLGDVPATKQLINISEQNAESSVIGVMEVPKSETNKYGIVDGKFINDRTLKMSSMIEKPKPENAPTNLATPGRYVLNSEIFQILETIPRGAGGEYQLTDAINNLAQKKDVFAHKFIGERFDTGSIPGYLDATLEFGLRSENKDLILELMQKKLEKYKK